MQFLRTLLVALTVGLAVAFAINNWSVVSVRLWGGLIADINLPLLLLVTFLAGLVPAALALQATRWRMRQRGAAYERAIADLRAASAAPAPAAYTPATTVEPVPPLDVLRGTDAPPLLDETRL